MMIEKDVWDFIVIGPWPEWQNPQLGVKKANKDWMAVEIARRIIFEGVSDQIAFNVMDLEDPKEI